MTTTTRYATITKLLGGQVHAMVSTKSKEVHFAVKNDTYRAFVEANRTIINKVPFTGKIPNQQWLDQHGILSLKKAGIEVK